MQQHMTINQLLTKHSKTKYISKFNTRRLIFLSDLRPYYINGKLEQLVFEITDKNKRDLLELLKILRRQLFYAELKIIVGMTAVIVTAVLALVFSTNN